MGSTLSVSQETCLSLANCLGLLGVLACNASVGKNIGRVSRANDSPFTPARPAFAIWLPIYAIHIVGLVGQFRDKSISRDLKGWFLAQCLFSSAWVLLFTREKMRLAGVSLLCYAMAMGMCYKSTQRWQSIRAESWPRVVTSIAMSLNFGWSLLATTIGACIACRVPVQIPVVAKVLSWTSLLYGVLRIQKVTKDPVLALPLAWGAFNRAHRDDPTALVFSGGFTLSAALFGLECALKS